MLWPLRVAALCAAPFLLGACASRVPRPDYLPILHSNPSPPSLLPARRGDNPDQPSRTLVRRFNREADHLLKRMPAESAEPAKIFERYDSRSGVLWSSNWTSRLDLTGVAWNGDRAGVLITRQHILFAKHWPRHVGEWVVFHDKDGRAHWRRITGRRLIGNGRTDDLAVARLDQPVPEQIKIYKFFPPGSFPGYTLLGARAFLTNRERQVVLRDVNSILRGYPGGDPAHLVRFREASGLPHVLQPSLQKGDSGNPGFLLLDGEPVLLETLTFGGYGRGPALTSLEYQEAILTAIRELGPLPVEHLLPFSHAQESQGLVR
ncbi:MAG TPA: hypothetical protein VMN36_05115 [Verrucomicrobiales bacterium]|nr:hypothetical protein [Verrucomicrobiales bacterium]